jgi:hypothetical protein
VGFANFFGSNAPTCSRIEIIADPVSLSGQNEGVDCAIPAGKNFPMGWSAFVNADVTCQFSPVESTTWGCVKALYR